MKHVKLSTIPLLVILCLAGFLVVQESSKSWLQPTSSINWGRVEKMKSDFLDYQKDSPLQIIGKGGNKKDLLESLDVVNASERTIVRYQLGWVTTDMKSRGLGEPFLGPVVDATIRPLQYHQTKIQGATFDRVLRSLNDQGIRHGLVLAGVTYVKFEDGSEWSYPLNLKRQFISLDPPEGYRVRINPILLKLIENIKEQDQKTGKSESGLACSSQHPEPQGFFASSLKKLQRFFRPTSVQASGGCYAWVCNPGLRHGCSISSSICNRGTTCPLENCDLEDCEAIPVKCDDLIIIDSGGGN